MNKLKLLIVEDDRSLLELYNVAIPDSIFEKRLADTGAKAIEAYVDWKPDIILLDIMLPDRSGFSLLEEIRTTREDKITAIIMSTSLDRKSDIDKCRDLDIQGYIVKPFDHKIIARDIIDFYSKSYPERGSEAMKALERGT
jgi:DNA-binding response OmpR family regulator